MVRRPLQWHCLCRPTFLGLILAVADGAGAAALAFKAAPSSPWAHLAVRA